MAPRLSGRVAIVTGASSGIGRAIALAYAAEGASVMCSDLQPNSREEKIKATHELILEQGGKASFLKTDVTDEAQVEAVVSVTVKRFGRLDMQAFKIWTEINTS
ncbi:reductase [Hyphodiscus hymeniophilus]|uniref:Reductase n=1 Tax=Hyphodiscus hymeniophilus TaxID=353542 RepID=A0A9P6VNE2_9HELO|nr:reductase [Hyphodiscus hymeniophilus]